MKLNCLISTVVLFQACLAFSDEFRAIQPDPERACSAAVVVSSPKLIHTTQLFPFDAAGKLVGQDDATQQIEQTLSNLNEVLIEASADWNTVVKLNFYVGRDELVGDVQKALKRRLTGPAFPAVSFATTRLPAAGALIGVDAIARPAQKPAAERTADQNVVKAFGRFERSRTFSTNTLFFISGQAEKGVDLADATAKTMLSLEASLKFCQQSKQSIRQLKCFLVPMSQADQVQRELERFFAPHPVPPVSYVEWISTLPIEIEVIAEGSLTKDENTHDGVSYLTPPDLKPSPVFSRICRVHDSELIFVSSLFGPPDSTGTVQVESIFQQLDVILKAAKSDFRHLVKATYYVSQDDPSQKLNELRPRYYDPKSPPAASKAQVTAVGRARVGIGIDMIAIPTP